MSNCENHKNIGPNYCGDCGQYYDRSEWFTVDGYKGVPQGNWLVQLEEESWGTNLAVMNNNNVAIIGTAFAFDMSRVVAYRELPEGV